MEKDTNKYWSKMTKLVPLHQIMDIELVVKESKIGGTVTKSNFVQGGNAHLMTIHNEAAEKIKKGDKIRVTFFANDDEIHKLDNGIRFTTKGTRYEVWNTENKGWDKIYEEFLPVED